MFDLKHMGGLFLGDTLHGQPQLIWDSIFVWCTARAAEQFWEKAGLPLSC
jgi:hypothetical protein